MSINFNRIQAAEVKLWDFSAYFWNTPRSLERDVKQNQKKKLLFFQQTEKFLDDCLKYPVACMIPNKLILTQPGGQLLHSMAGHRADIISLDLSADNKTIVTCKFSSNS